MIQAKIQSQRHESFRRAQQWMYKTCKKTFKTKRIAEQQLRKQQRLTTFSVASKLGGQSARLASHECFRCNFPANWKHNTNTRQQTAVIMTMIGYWYDARNCWIRSPSRFSCSALRRIFSKHCWTVRAAAAAGCSLKNSCTHHRHISVHHHSVNG